MNSSGPRIDPWGTPLFICYINDLPQCLLDATAFIHADDTAILVNGQDLGTINDTLNNEFQSVCKWFNANKLSVNSAKSNTMLFCGNRSKYKGGELSIPTSPDSNVLLEQVPEFQLSH